MPTKSRLHASPRSAAPSVTPAVAWRMLGLGVAAQAAGTFLVTTPAYLIPFLHSVRGLSLPQAGLLSSAPTFGMVLTLVAWGALADRFGERWVIAGGLALTAAFAFAGSASQSYTWLGVFLCLGGAASASTNAASGRVVAGWFPRERRGLAMGIRQMSQPLGVGAAALVVPPLAAHSGITAPLLVAGIATIALAAACTVGIKNPPRPSSNGGPPVHQANPYRRDGFLARIHLVSILLVVPQFTLSTFGLIWLTGDLGWGATAAGTLIAVAQFTGALGRIAVGSLSDRMGTRVVLLRRVALAGVAAMALLGASGVLHWGVAAGMLLIVASTISVADNGLAFTSVAESAGPAWSGRALGVQNTGQFVAASAVGPGIGALIATVGFPITFGLVALAPLVSIRLIPSHDEHWGSSASP